MANQGSTKERPAGSPAAGTAALVPPPPGDPRPEDMMGTGPAAEIIGRSARTVERWVDDGKLRGGRPTDPLTGEVVENSHRWVDGEHVVALAVGSGRAHLVPEQWRHLIPQQQVPASTPDNAES